MEWPALNAVDWVMLAVLVLSTVVGLFRGLVLEVLSLGGWFAAVFAAIWLRPVVAPWLPIGAPGEAGNTVAALVTVFVVVLIVWGLASRAISRMIGKTPLKPVDRLLGALFGVARALVLLLAVTALVAWTPAARADAWRESVTVRTLQSLLDELLPLLPFEWPRRASDGRST